MQEKRQPQATKIRSTSCTSGRMISFFFVEEFVVRLYVLNSRHGGDGVGELEISISPYSTSTVRPNELFTIFQISPYFTKHTDFTIYFGDFFYLSPNLRLTMAATMQPTFNSTTSKFAAASHDVPDQRKDPSVVQRTCITRKEEDH